jgi:hypothetical protein
MARREKGERRVGLGCFGSLFVTIMSVVLVIVVAVAIVGNMTVASIGLADVPLFEGQTLATLGFAEYKIKDVIEPLTELITSLTEDEAVIAEKVVDKDAAPTEEDKAAVNDIFAGSSAANKGEDGETSGGVDFGNIINEKVTFTEKKEISVTDVQLAAIFNGVISGAGQISGLEMLQQFNAQVQNVKIESVGGKLHLITVMSLDISSMTASIPFPIGNKLYVTITNEITGVSTQEADLGAIQTAPVSMKLNDLNDSMMTMFTGVILSMMGQEGLTEDYIIGTVGNVFGAALNNLGKVGTYDGTTEVNSLEAITPAQGSGSSRVPAVIKLVTYTETEVYPS